MSDPTVVPKHLDALQRRSLPVAAVGGVLLAAGAFLDTAQFFRSYLLGWLFWTGVGVGCLSIAMISHLTGGLWGLLIRRFLEAGARTLPVMAVLFLPVVLGLAHLYPWAGHEADADPVLQAKRVYLNPAFFLARAVFYFAVWAGLATTLSRLSLRLDAGPDARVSRRLRGLSGAGLVLLGLTITFSSVDWGMSLAPHWFSTMYGVLFMVGQTLSAMSFVILVLALLAGESPVREAIRARTVQDLGKLLFAFTMLWGYVNFSQFLITWSGNIAEETPFYVVRRQGGWDVLAVLLVVLHFAVPFLLLLSRDLKRRPATLARVAGLLFAARLLDLYFLVGPDLRGHGRLDLPFGFHWLDLAAPVALGGVFVFFFVRNLRTRPVLPVGEPDMAALLQGAPVEGH